MRRTLIGKSKKKRFALLLIVAIAALATLAAAGHTDDDDDWWGWWGGHGGHFHHGVKHKKHPHHDDHGHHKHHGHDHHHHQPVISPIPVVVFPDDEPDVQQNESEVNVDADVTNVVDFSNANVSGATSHAHHPDCHYWYGQGCHNGHTHGGSVGPLIDLEVSQLGEIDVNVGVDQDNND